MGDIGTVVLKERSRLSRDGFMTISIAISRLTKEVLAGPDINSQGFIYMKESSDTIDKVKKSVLNTAKEWKESKTSIPELKKQIKQRTSEVLLNNTRRRPVILPVVLQV